jgi:threonine aldolase
VTKTINFASDNTAGVASEILSSLSVAATLSTMPYGDDVYTKKLQSLANEIFEREVKIYPVTTGSAANALALATVSPPYGIIFCHKQAHIEEDECAAPEFYIGGGKLSLLEGDNAKFTAAGLQEKLTLDSPVPAVHRAQPAAVSITQATELGTIYTVEEISAISEVCKSNNIPLHMDGARIANAIVSLGVAPADATWRAGVDVLSLGATKNGVFAAEAVVFFDTSKAADFEFRRKRGGHLLSKLRFLSAQLVPYLNSNYWLKLAGNSNCRAKELAKGLEKLPSISLLFEVQTNMVFIKMPSRLVDVLKNENCIFYSWGEDEGMIFARLVTSFNTTKEEVDSFLAVVNKAVSQR